MPRNRGAIVQVGSALAYRGIPLQSAYCGAKHAIQGFTESVRPELLHDKSDVHITMVQLPGGEHPAVRLGVVQACRSGAQPVAPIYQPEVVARAILHAGDHPMRREYWVGGSTVGTLIGDKFGGRPARPLPGAYRHRLPADREPQPADAPANLLGARRRPGRAATTVPTAGSTTRRRRAARSSGPPATTACSAPRRGLVAVGVPREPEAAAASSAAADRARVGTFVSASPPGSSARVGTVFSVESARSALRM